MSNVSGYDLERSARIIQAGLVSLGQSIEKSSQVIASAIRTNDKKGESK